MTALAGRTPPAPGPVRWAVRAYAPLLVVCILAAVVAVPWLLRTQAQTVYESQALVVARQFTLPLAALPRYGEAVFDNGAVAADVGRQFGLSTAGDSLIPEKLSVVTGQDSVVMTVTARDSDAVLAADIANAAAEAYLDELNRPGPGLAVFVLQSAATPSGEPTSGAPGTPVQLAVGAVAGGLLGLGLIGLLFVLRRPVVDPHDIEAVVGAPVLGVVRFPGRTVHDANAVPGLAPVARALARSGAHDVYVVSPPDRRAQRAAVARMLVAALARWRPAALQTYDASRGGWVRPDDRDLGYAPSLVITDVAKPLDAGPDAVDSDTLLVVREGTPERRLWDMMADHADSSYLGVVVVRRTSWLNVRLRPSAGERLPAPTADERPAAHRRHAAPVTAERIAPAPAPAPAADRGEQRPEGPASAGTRAAAPVAVPVGEHARPAAEDQPAPPAEDQPSPAEPQPSPAEHRPPTTGTAEPAVAAAAVDVLPGPSGASAPSGDDVPAERAAGDEQPEEPASPPAEALTDAQVDDRPASDAPGGTETPAGADHPAETPAGDETAAGAETAAESTQAETEAPAETSAADGDRSGTTSAAPVVTAQTAPPGPASLPWQDAASLLGLGEDDEPSPDDAAPATAAPGWPGHGSSPRSGASTGWPGSS